MIDHASTHASRRPAEGRFEAAPICLILAVGLSLGFSAASALWCRALQAQVVDLEARAGRLDRVHGADAQLERERAANRAVLAGPEVRGMEVGR